MIYSQWQPGGGYRYFEAPDGVPINDDQPVPRLTATSDIGVSSLIAGRPIPSGAVEVGEGPVAMGMIAPAARHGHLSGIEMPPASTVVYGALGLGLLAAVVIWARS